MFEELAKTVDLLLSRTDADAVALFAYERRSGQERRFFDEVLPRRGFECHDTTRHCSGVAARWSDPALTQNFVHIYEVRRKRKKVP